MSWTKRTWRGLAACSRCWRRYAEIEDLVNVGAYVPGINKEFDLAVQARPRILAYLRQDSATVVAAPDSKRQLIELAQWIEHLETKLQNGR
jgi:flagellar biosynthesis/type III secretory pathway ATPase